MITKIQVEALLRTIPDPEIGISIVDLGLVYDVRVDKKGNVNIKMTLTSIGCPLFDLIAGPVREKVGEIAGVKSVNVELTFEPPWSTDRMTEDAKIQMGLA